MTFKRVVAVYIFNEKGEVLLLHHQKLASWLPPGGHVEEGELTHACAIREVREETGLEVQFLFDEFESIVIEVDQNSQRSTQLPSPRWVQLEDVGTHFQEDFIYIAKVLPESNIHTQEKHKIAWFDLEEALTLSMFDNVKRHLIKLKRSLHA